MNTTDDAQLALVVLLAGLVIVFVVLTVLIWIIQLYGNVIRCIVQKKKSSMAVKPQPAPKPVAAAVPQAPQTAEPQIEPGIPGEVLAAIASAVYMTYEDSSKPVAIKSVRRAPSTSPHSAWGAAGRLENTRPF